MNINNSTSHASAKRVHIKLSHLRNFSQPCEVKNQSTLIAIPKIRPQTPDNIKEQVTAKHRLSYNIKSQKLFKHLNLVDESLCVPYELYETQNTPKKNQRLNIQPKIIGPLVGNISSISSLPNNSSQHRQQAQNLCKQDYSLIRQDHRKVIRELSQKYVLSMEALTLKSNLQLSEQYQCPKKPPVKLSVVTDKSSQWQSHLQGLSFILNQKTPVRSRWRQISKLFLSL